LKVRRILAGFTFCAGVIFGQSPHESSPGYNSATDPCYDLKQQLRSVLRQLEENQREAKDALARYQSYSKTQEAQEAAALEGVGSAISDFWGVCKCFTGLDPASIPAASVKLTRGLLTVGLVVLPGTASSGPAMVRNTWQTYSYYIGQVKALGEQARQLEARLRRCCSLYPNPPSDTNPPPPNPGGGSPPSTGSGAGAGSSTAGGTVTNEGGGPVADWFFELAGSESVRGSDPVGGPGGNGPMHGFYGFPGYIAIPPDGLQGYNSERLKRAMENVTRLELHCIAVDRLRRSPNPPPFATGTRVSKCYKDFAYGAGYIVEELNMKGRRGHSPVELKLLDEMGPSATALRTRSANARQAAERTLQ